MVQACYEFYLLINQTLEVILCWRGLVKSPNRSDPSHDKLYHSITSLLWSKTKQWSQAASTGVLQLPTPTMKSCLWFIHQSWLLTSPVRWTAYGGVLNWVSLRECAGSWRGSSWSVLAGGEGIDRLSILKGDLSRIFQLCWEKYSRDAKDCGWIGEQKNKTWTKMLWQIL